MAKITLKGKQFHTAGQLPKPGETSPAFTLVKNDLSEVNSDFYKGKKKVLNIFPSIDTSVCSITVRNFYEKISIFPQAALLCISKDLPFAQQRFCEKEHMKNGEVLSAFRSSFAKDYGVEILDGPLRGLCARAVLVISEENRVLYAELVGEITQEPNYEFALNYLS